MKASGLPQGLKGKFDEVENILTYKQFNGPDKTRAKANDFLVLIGNPQLKIESRDEGLKILSGLELTESEEYSEINSFNSL